MFCPGGCVYQGSSKYEKSLMKNIIIWVGVYTGISDRKYYYLGGCLINTVYTRIIDEKYYYLSGCLYQEGWIESGDGLCSQSPESPPCSTLLLLQTCSSSYFIKWKNHRFWNGELSFNSSAKFRSPTVHQAECYISHYFTQSWKKESHILWFKMALYLNIFFCLPFRKLMDSSP